MNTQSTQKRKTHEEWLAEYEAICEKSRVYYRGYTIEPEDHYRYAFYPTRQGRDDDADFDGESFVYCGNAKFASSIEDAKDEIDAILALRKHYAPQDTTSYRGYIIRNEWEYDCGKCDYFYFLKGNESAGTTIPFVTLQEVKDIINEIRAENPEVFIVKTRPAKSLGPALTKIVGWRHQAELFADKVNGVIV